MENVRDVNIGMLRQAINDVLDFIEQDLGQSEVPLPANFYWTVPDAGLYELTNPPVQLDVGSLNDDLEFVKAASTDREQAVPLILMHIAPLLYAFAHSLPSYSIKAQ